VKVQGCGQLHSIISAQSPPFSQVHHSLDNLDCDLNNPVSLPEILSKPSRDSLSIFRQQITHTLPPEDGRYYLGATDA
jgi:hypothetical protein